VLYPLFKTHETLVQMSYFCEGAWMELNVFFFFLHMYNVAWQKEIW
jgi:hypothetical protein